MKRLFIIILLGLSLINFGSSALPDGLIHAWGLESITANFSGTNLTNNNAVTFGTAKYINGAVLGAGNTNKYLSNSSSFVRIFGGPVSISVWINSSGIPQSGTPDTGIVSFGDTASKVSYLLTYDYVGPNNFALRWTRLRNGAGTDTASYPINLTSNTTFYHIVATYDGANMRLWVDDVFQAIASSTGNGSSGGQGDLRIGDNVQSTGRTFRGTEDELYIWPRNLTRTEITQLQTSYYPFSTITLNSPTNNTIYLIGNLTFNWTSFLGGSNLSNTTLFINGAYNETINISETTNTTIVYKSFGNNSNYTWTVQSCSTSSCVNSSTYFFNISNQTIFTIYTKDPVGNNYTNIIFSGGINASGSPYQAFYSSLGTNQSNLPYLLNFTITDINGYYSSSNQSIWINVNQTAYPITLTNKSVNLSFFFYNGTNYFTKGFWVDSSLNTANFSDDNFTRAIGTLAQGIVNVQFGFNLSSIYNYTQFFEFDNDLQSQIDANLTVLEITNKDLYVKIIDENGNPVDNVLVKVYINKPSNDTSYHLIGQRYTGSAGQGKTFFFTDLDSYTYILYSKDNYQMGSKLLDLSLDTYTSSNPLTLIINRENAELERTLIATSCGWYNSNTTKIPLGFYKQEGTIVRYKTSYMSSNGTVALNGEGLGYANLTNGIDFVNTDTTNVTITIWDGDNYWGTLTVPYYGIENTKFTEPSGLDLATKRKIYWIGLLIIVGILGLLIKGEEEGTGAGGRGKIIFFVGAFLISILSYNAFNFLLTICGFYVIGKTIRKVIGE